MSEARIEAVLWDADGVLQHGRRSWESILTEIGGPDFPAALFAAEKPALRGEEPFRDAIARLLRSWHLEEDPDRVLAMWEDFDPDPEAFAVVAGVRAAGTPSHLATNQQDHRTRYMRGLGYDALFDRVFYSSEVSAMKPEPAYFHRVLDALRIEPSRVLFIDDNEQNIESARALGIRAHHHDPASGAAGLRSALAAAGVPVQEPGPGARHLDGAIR